MTGITRRYAHEAGESWSKWGDPAGLAYERHEWRWFVATIWTWAVTLGAWVGIAASVIR